MAIGSTTHAGAWFYAASLPFWWAIAIGHRLWGMAAINIATMLLVVKTLLS